MKTTTSNPKEKLVLREGLDVLHFESVEWLSNIAFYKDETKFFAELLEKRKTNDKAQLAYTKILENLDTVHAELFDNLADDIMAHERVLSHVQKGEKDLVDSAYSGTHYLLKIRMRTFTNNFREFKKMVFGYAKKL